MSAITPGAATPHTKSRLVLPSTRALAPGDVAPKWGFLNASGQVVDLTQDWVAGQWIVLCLHPETRAPGDVAAADLVAASDTFQALGVRFFVVRAEGSRCVDAALPVLIDHHDAMSAQLGLSPPRPLTIVLRPDGHFAQFFNGTVETQLLAARRLTERAVADNPPMLMSVRHPPVLLVPEVFSPTECRLLIDIFHSQGQVLLDQDSAANHLGADYKMRVFEHLREDRVDHFFFDPATVEFLSHRLNRIIPEIAKAFQYPVTKYESLRMARYRGTRGGLGHGHRDNVPPTVYRRFAMSINLNTEAFEGGELRFPEFGNVRYRPASGTAIIFSSSLLHEALHVTAGQRFVFLAFLFGER